LSSDAGVLVLRGVEKRAGGAPCFVHSRPAQAGLQQNQEQADSICSLRV
jgi:hypothetical protein